VRDEDKRRLWKLTESLETELKEEPAPTIEDLVRRRLERSTNQGPRSRAVRWPWLGAMAAAITGLALAGIGLVRGRAGPVKLAAAEFSTGPDELVTVSLDDGSVVRLGPRTHLKVVQSRTERALWLDGRAYFAVARDASPFVVRTAAGTATALGTRFDVEARGADMRVLVVEGRVALAAGAGRATLQNRQVGTVSQRQPMTVAVVADVEPSLRWLGGFLAFQATSLGSVAQELSRHYGVPIQVRDSALATETVTGWFSNEPLDDVLKVVCRAVRAQCVIGTAGVTIEP